MQRSHTICLSIERSFDDVYDYLSRPANFENWAAVETGSFKPLENGDWQGNTPWGLRHFRFCMPNNFGVLDHAMFVPGGELSYSPMRVMPNEEGTELTFTFYRRAGMDDAVFASTIDWIHTDLLTLKSLLEATNRA